VLFAIESVFICASASQQLTLGKMIAASLFIYLFEESVQHPLKLLGMTKLQKSLWKVQKLQNCPSKVG
jgi:hypothetical protein